MKTGLSGFIFYKLNTQGANQLFYIFAQMIKTSDPDHVKPILSMADVTQWLSQEVMFDSLRIYVWDEEETAD